MLETDLLSKEDAEIGLKFEAEQQSARADRLQRRLDELFRGGTEKGSVSSRDAASRRAQELEDVVDALKKVVEKQQSELSSLRARLASAARVAEAAKTAKALKQTVASLEAELAELRGSEEEATALRRRASTSSAGWRPGRARRVMTPPRRRSSRRRRRRQRRRRCV